ncbi:MAG: hypothetical protein MK212_01990 [Saprospiraceae bacterium]|nr:hypothetical protein [Saprospiraceae bacterium]
MRYLVILFLCCALGASAQDDEDFGSSNGANFEPMPEEQSGGVGWGLKGGLTIANQRWNFTQKEPLFTYHGALHVDVMGGWKGREGKKTMQRYGFMAQLGYHQRGSRYRNWFVGSQKLKDVFHNISLGAGGKGCFLVGGQNILYYGFGLRLEVTAAQRLVYSTHASLVNRFNYGLFLLGGVEFNLPKSPLGLILEVNISPDISRQVYMPPGIYIGDNLVTGDPLYSVEEKVINLSLEVSAGFRFGN